MLRIILLRFLLARWWIRGVILLVLLSAVAAIIHRTYHYVRGRRNRDAGIPCIQCKRLAFPVEGTVNRYHCWICGSRFDGPEHF